MSEIAITKAGAPVPSDGHAPSLFNFIASALENPAIDVNKLEALLKMQRTVRADEAQEEFARAMNAAQADAQPVARTAENKQTNSFFAKLETVDAMIRPVYLRHGFSLSFDEEPANEKGEMTIVCEVTHTGGHSKKYRLNSPPDTMGPKGTPTKTALHGRGSTVTFLRRYLTCNIFNIVLRNQDDDGNRGGMRFISEAQANELAAEMSALKLDVNESGAFLDYMGADALSNIDERDWKKAKNALAIKARKRAEEGRA